MNKTFEFLSTPSARRATFYYLSNLTRVIRFLSTPSARRATGYPDKSACKIDKFLSTPSARRATAIEQNKYQILMISIHALREEGDLIQEVQSYSPSISIHALREEGDPFRSYP